MKVLGKFFSILVFAIVAYLLLMGGSVLYQANKDQRDKVDAIVVLGAAQYNGEASPVLKARLDHAAHLWNEQVAPVVVVTGGKAEGDSTTEATAAANYLGTLGVPDSKVLREVHGRNTWDSLQAAARFLKDRDMNSVVVVSDPFHVARSRAMAQSLGLEANVSATRTSPITGAATLPYYAKEIAAMAVGIPFSWEQAGKLADLFGSGPT